MESEILAIKAEVAAVFDKYCETPDAFKVRYEKAKKSILGRLRSSSPVGVARNKLTGPLRVNADLFDSIVGKLIIEGMVTMELLETYGRRATFYKVTEKYFNSLYK